MSSTIPWPGRGPSGAVTIPLPWSFVPPLADVLDLPEAPLSRKDELHLTLLSRTEADAAARTLPEHEWAAWFARHDWTLRLTDRWYLLRDDEAGRTVRSVIAEVDCDALNVFRRELGHAAATPLDATLPHVTLWVGGTTKGIGLGSLAGFEAKKVRRLTAAELQGGLAVA